MKLGMLLLLIGLPLLTIVGLHEYKESVEYTSLKNESEVVRLNLPLKSELKSDETPIKLESSKTTITLESKNMVVFRGPVSAKSVADIQNEVLKLSYKLSKNDDIFLVLDTPGGSVFAGLELIDFLNALPQKVHTITLFAASMGFYMAQTLNTRYISNQGVLMSHRASVGGMGGQLDGEFEQRYKMIKRKVDYLAAVAYTRMGISKEKYNILVNPEYWVHGFDAVKEKVADKQVNLRCGKSLTGTTNGEVNTFFGNVKVQYSKCPLIRGPLKLDYSNISSSNVKKVKDAVTKVFFNKHKYIEEFILTDKYLAIFN